jgi:hypothetical protein
MMTLERRLSLSNDVLKLFFYLPKNDLLVSRVSHPTRIPGG